MVRSGLTGFTTSRVGSPGLKRLKKSSSQLLQRANSRDGGRGSSAHARRSQFGRQRASSSLINAKNKRKVNVQRSRSGQLP